MSDRGRAAVSHVARRCHLTPAEEARLWADVEAHLPQPDSGRDWVNAAARGLPSEQLRRLHYNREALDRLERDLRETEARAVRLDLLWLAVGAVVVFGLLAGAWGSAVAGLSLVVSP